MQNISNTQRFARFFPVFFCEKFKILKIWCIGNRSAVAPPIYHSPAPHLRGVRVWRGGLHFGPPPKGSGVRFLPPGKTFFLFCNEQKTHKSVYLFTRMYIYGGGGGGGAQQKCNQIRWSNQQLEYKFDGAENDYRRCVSFGKGEIKSMMMMMLGRSGSAPKSCWAEC